MRRSNRRLLRCSFLTTTRSEQAGIHHVLVPGPFGGLRLVVRCRRAETRVGPFIWDDDHLRSLLDPHCSSVILCGSRYAHAVMRAVHRQADVHVVPMRWLRHIPRDRPDRLAARAVALLSTHRAAPIQTLYRWPGPALPF